MSNVILHHQETWPTKELVHPAEGHSLPGFEDRPNDDRNLASTECGLWCPRACRKVIQWITLDSMQTIVELPVFGKGEKANLSKAERNDLARLTNLLRKHYGDVDE